MAGRRHCRAYSRVAPTPRSRNPELDQLSIARKAEARPGRTHHERDRRGQRLRPPGDIHRVTNAGDRTAITIHVYGTDLSRIGSSALRYHDLPVGP